MRQWFKNFMRARQMINPQYAALAKNKLAIIYTIAAWNIFGLTIAQLYKANVPKVHDSYDYAKVFGIKDAKVLKMSNFSIVDQYEIKLSEEEIKDFTEVIGTKEKIEKYEQENEERIKAAKEKEKTVIANS